MKAVQLNKISSGVSLELKSQKPLSTVLYPLSALRRVQDEEIHRSTLLLKLKSLDPSLDMVSFQKDLKKHCSSSLESSIEMLQHCIDLKSVGKPLPFPWKE